MAIADLIAQTNGRLDVPDFAGALMEGAQAGRSAGWQNLQAEEQRQQTKQRTLANLATQQTQDDLTRQREAMGANTTYGAAGPELNEAGYLSQLAKSGAVPLAYGEQARFRASQIAAEQAKIDKAQKEIERRTQILGGIKSPMQLAAAIPEMERMGVNVDQLRTLPFQRNWKEEIESLMNIGLTHKERLDQAKQSLDEQKNVLEWNKADIDQQYKRDTFGLSERQFQETQRANKAREGIDWAQMNQAKATADKAPSGYRYTASGDLEAIPGGPADAKKIALDEKAKAVAQKATDFADMGLNVIDQLITSPGLGGIVGIRGKIPTIPGTDAAKSNALAEQLEGQAFLQAFQSLKGAGAITETEGKKASAAIARLNRSQSKTDYVQALNELRGILVETKSRAAEKAIPGASAPTVTSQAEYDALPSGSRYVDASGAPHVKGGR